MNPSAEALRAAIKANSAERLAAPAERPRQWPFAAILLACLAAHCLLIAVFVFGDFSNAAEPARGEEIQVEIVAEIPPEHEPQPPPRLAPPPELISPPVVKEKPPLEKVQLEDVKAAFDAPAAGNASETRRGEQDQPTQAPRLAAAPKLPAEQPQNRPEQQKAAARSEEAAKPSAPADRQKLADLEPDAEALDRVRPEPPAKPKEKSANTNRGPSAQGKRSTVAQQLAALAPAPHFSFGAAAKAAPISGGREKASYESLLFGLILRQLHLPPEVRASRLIHVGRIGLFVDELGNLTHQALYLASGDPVLDAAWLSAVKRAAPFPPPPRGLPHGFLLQYSNQE